MSPGLPPAARTHPTTCPAPARGSATSSSFRTSGPPNSRTRIAFTSVLLHSPSLDEKDADTRERGQKKRGRQRCGGARPFVGGCVHLESRGQALKSRGR